MGLRFGRWSWPAQVGAVGAVCLAGLLFFELLWDGPQREMLAMRRRALQEKNHELERTRRTAQRLPALEADIGRLAARLERLRSRLPARRDASVLLRRLETAATGSGLTMRAFLPRPVVERSWYTEWPIRLELVGTYGRLGVFFDRIGRFERIINLQDITVRALDAPDPNATIAADCIALTFVAHDTEPSGVPFDARAEDGER